MMETGQKLRLHPAVAMAMQVEQPLAMPRRLRNG
jgi:hypothetical protein